jgi:hypothetical protein
MMRRSSIPENYLETTPEIMKRAATPITITETTWRNLSDEFAEDGARMLWL